MKKHLYAPMDKNAIIVILAALVIALSLMLWGNQVFHPKQEVVSESVSEQKEIVRTINENVDPGYKPIFGSLMYRITPVNSQFNHFYRLKSDYPYDTGSFTAAAEFVYVPKDAEDAVWASCYLPVISEYTTDPIAEQMKMATEDTVKKFGDKYYVYDSEMQIPCSIGGENISGNAEKEWRARRQVIRDIFDSLEAI